MFTCIGRRVSLLRAFHKACSRLGLKCTIAGTDTTENSPALQCCDHKHIVKPVFHRDYARQIVEIVRKEKVDILVPTVDLDLPILARHRSKLAQMGCTALVPSSRVVRICQDKRQTFRFLKEHGFDTPYTMTDSVAKILKRRPHNYPYFLKPWDGHASRSSMKVHNWEELAFYAKRIPNCMVQEFINGQEHTVDVLTDCQGKVRCVVPRLRIETRSGEVSKGMTVKHHAIIEQSKLLIETLGVGLGVTTIQCFLTGHDRIKFIEINPRFGGGVPLSIKAGADFPRWILQLWLGKKPRIGLSDWQDGLIMLRYDEAVWFQK